MGDELSCTLEGDYEVVMLHLARTSPPPAPVPVEGGAGADRLCGAAGDDALSCGAGADFFRFAEDGFGPARIGDFAPGIDVTGLSALAPGTGWPDVLATHASDNAQGARFEVAGGSLTPLGIDAAELSQGDFMFRARACLRRAGRARQPLGMARGIGIADRDSPCFAGPR